jgi:hypothetical protein
VTLNSSCASSYVDISHGMRLLLAQGKIWMAETERDWETDKQNEYILGTICPQSTLFPQGPFKEIKLFAKQNPIWSPVKVSKRTSSKLGSVSACPFELSLQDLWHDRDFPALERKCFLWAKPSSTALPQGASISPSSAVQDLSKPLYASLTGRPWQQAAGPTHRDSGSQGHRKGLEMHISFLSLFELRAYTLSHSTSPFLWWFFSR